MSRRYLHMLAIRDQVLSRGAINASFTQVASTGVQQATRTLFDKCAELLNQRTQPHDPLGELDGLRPDRLIPAVRTRLTSLEELSDPRLEITDLAQRLDHLRALHAGAVSRLSRDAVGLAELVVQESAQKVRESLDKAFLSRPAEIVQVLEQARQVLAAIALPGPDLQALHRLKRLVQAFQDLDGGRSRVTKSTIEKVKAHLLSRGRQAFEEALSTYAAFLIAQALRRAVSDLHALLDETTRRSSIYRQNMDRARAALAAKEKQAAERHRISRASVILPLTGPDENQVLTGMMERARCSDVNQLAHQVLERFEEALRAFAAAHCPAVDAQLAPLVKLLLAVDPQDAADLFAQVTESCLGEGHTLYELIQQHGIDRCARQLHRRAEPTCHLGERNRERFNVPSAHLTIVRLPRAVGTRDHAIRERLQAAFEDLDACIFSPETGDDAVVVVRLEVGWPIGIDQANPALYERYLESGLQGHLPHLLGILPDSPLGEVSPRYHNHFDSGE